MSDPYPLVTLSSAGVVTSATTGQHYEQAALEIEGQIESSQTMANYYSTLEAMRTNLDL